MNQQHSQSSTERSTPLHDQQQQQQQGPSTIGHHQQQQQQQQPEDRGVKRKADEMIGFSGHVATTVPPSRLPKRAIITNEKLLKKQQYKGRAVAPRVPRAPPLSNKEIAKALTTEINEQGLWDSDTDRRVPEHASQDSRSKLSAE
ncbi:hypothetical protein G5I_00347 [Acromyrmex echinatior]|uniref:Uncharacterized protein n=1 Tax=Acromyrmex echinatior TaxID=103372 RepID=F4W4M6_ACREC|nr:hypothetical protein G5I_00347 [Acromyrmex echinatior]